MRRRVFYLDHKSYPRLASGSGVTAATAPGLSAETEYSVSGGDASPVTKLSAQGSFIVSLAEKKSNVHFSADSRSAELVVDGFYYRFTHGRFEGEGAGKDGRTELRAEIPGRIIKVIAAAGAVVEAGDPILIQEAMKMEMTLKAPARVKIAEILVEAGAQVEADAVLVRFGDAGK